MKGQEMLVKALIDKALEHPQTGEHIRSIAAVVSEVGDRMKRIEAKQDFIIRLAGYDPESLTKLHPERMLLELVAHESEV